MGNGCVTGVSGGGTTWVNWWGTHGALMGQLQQTGLFLTPLTLPQLPNPSKIHTPKPVV